jgi:hypothetical protein
MPKHFRIAAYREFLRGKLCLESGCLHFRPANAVKVSVRKTALESLDEVAGQQVAGGFPCDHRNPDLS